MISEFLHSFQYKMVFASLMFSEVAQLRGFEHATGEPASEGFFACVLPHMGGQIILEGEGFAALCAGKGASKLVNGLPRSIAETYL